MKRIASLFSVRTFNFLLATLMGLFFVQSTRLLIGLLYSRTSSASLYSLFAEGSVPSTTAGAVSPSIVSNEITFLGVVLAMPVLMLLFGRFRLSATIAVILACVGRVLIVTSDAPISQTIATEIVVGASLMYLVTLITQQAQLFPYFFILGFGLDQVIRAAGNTFDPSMQTNYQTIQLALSGIGIALGIITLIRRQNRVDIEEGTGFDKNKGTLPFWSAVSLGALLFLQFSLLSLPNAITGRTDSDYTLFVPIVLIATILPIVPFVRSQARQIIAPFESNTRGWVWLIIIILLVVIGFRIPRITIGNSEFMLGGFALSLAQLFVSLLWWWFVRPKAERERNFSGLWLIATFIVFSILLSFDLLTYEYAFVRNFAPPLDFLNTSLVPLLRGFRGFGLAIVLLSIFLSNIPMIQSSRRIPWLTGNRFESLVSVGCILVLGGLAVWFSRPVAVLPVLNVNEIRVGTYNIHGGYSEFFAPSIEGVASAIQQSGAQVVLLQDVDAGRLTSFGIDQTLWLARYLGMDRRYFATNEGLTGLAVLSNIPIVFDDGVLIPSIDQQTGLQRVQIQPDNDVIKIYNTSLGLLLEGNSLEEQESNQRTQLNFILSTIKLHIEQDYNGQLGRTIFGGTFNNIPSSPLLQSLVGTVFSDPFAGAPREKSDTLIRLDRSARIDYLWIWQDTLQTTGYGVITENAASDHRLAFVGIEIR